MPTSIVSETGNLTRELAGRVSAASAARTPLRIVGGDTKAFYGRAVDGDPLDVSGHAGVVDYEPSELVITARAGTRIEEIEALLAQRGQRLAFEPPILGPESTLGGVVAAGMAGPRRPFAGAVRDSVLGVTVLDGKGEALRFGGTVFKNVAGFDAFRLMAGGLGCLGVLLEVSLRVAPIPAAELSRSFDLPWRAAQARLTGLMRRPLPLSGGAYDSRRLHLRLSGPAGAVAAAATGLGGEATPAAFWDDLRHRRLGLLRTAPRLWRLSVPRTADLSDLPGPAIRDWAGAEVWLDSDAPAEAIRRLAAQAGGHATLYRGATAGEEVFTPLPPGLLALHRRVKAAFDPAGVFNPGRMYEGL
ncbi:MAG TPA: glycolate oxidase subunit GlcE [Caulobacteraceae bacterium]|nr:glycolate oxidase subunit GlcE [Caulobacteraceae bacterium]